MTAWAEPSEVELCPWVSQRRKQWIPVSEQASKVFENNLAGIMMNTSGFSWFDSKEQRSFSPFNFPGMIITGRDFLPSSAQWSLFTASLSFVSRVAAKWIQNLCPALFKETSVGVFCFFLNPFSKGGHFSMKHFNAKFCSWSYDAVSWRLECDPWFCWKSFQTVDLPNFW